MIHLAANVSPVTLGRYPYTPILTGGSYEKATVHKLGISPAARIYYPPIISSYVGPDITSGVLATSLHLAKETVLFVDIGTNGEMVLSLGGKLFCASTAAGPAFEGMNIEHGMRAAPGAIESFKITDDGNIETEIIGDEEPLGICGSGLLDIISELVRVSVIKKTGRFSDLEELPYGTKIRTNLELDGKKKRFKIADGIYLTQNDIRQVQLAKAAIRAGIEFLLKTSGVTKEDVNRVLIAGSFGYHVSEKSLIGLGLLPEEFAGRVEYVVNTSKTGGEAFLLNKDFRNEMKVVANQISVVELTEQQDFDKVFVDSMGF
jgi:uncharacterized 2Fe-2S/4Fe-4S cluster protein (DUF4445 family)